MSPIWLKKNEQRLIEIRRYLHQHPELGFKEIETTAYLMGLLREAGYVIHQNEKMKTGFYCDYGIGGSPLLGIRCDLDALQIFDAKEVAYRSQNDGVMHACGHDVHMAVVAGLALWMKEEKHTVPGTVRFIFQPAEEKAPGGALAMIEGGTVDKMDHIIGMHVLPKLPVGQVGLKYGPMSAYVDLIDITLKGKGGHTSRPHDTVDLIASTARLISAIDEVLLHQVDPQSPVVLSFGKIHGGETFNVIPSAVNLQGTLRYLNGNERQMLHNLIAETIHNQSLTSGAEINWHLPYSAPGIQNDEALTTILIEGAKKALGTEQVKFLPHASMGGEDFAYYLEKIPGAYFRIGCGLGYITDLHTINFDVDERCISTAIQVIREAVKVYFEKVRG
ncbi:MAG: amidohydrolase [FCB group bacterium]|nr:amidohydrolase [FCB group bacterium]